MHTLRDQVLHTQPELLAQYKHLDSLRCIKELFMMLNEFNDMAMAKENFTITVYVVSLV